MKYQIFLITFLVIAINLNLNAQKQCNTQELLDNIVENVSESDKKISLGKNPYKEEIAYKDYYYNPNDSESNSVFKDTNLLTKRRKLRLYFISSKKYKNEALIKIFNLNKNKEVYSIKEKPDNKPSFVDIDLDETTKFRIEIKFKEDKEGCVVRSLGVIEE